MAIKQTTQPTGKYVNEGTLFLKEHTTSSVLRVLSFLEDFEQCKLTEIDYDIASELYEEIKQTNKLPNWWGSQESAYFEKIEKTKDLKSVVKYIIFRYKFREYPRKKIVSNFPIYVLVEPVSSCNLRCPFCFQVDKSFTRKPFMGLMDVDLFKDVIDECEANGTGAITLASRGEPTMHPRLPEMLDYLKGKFFEIKLNTNGTRITEELCHSLLKNEINDVIFSIDSEQKELYEQMRKNASFEKVLKNVQMLHRIRKDYYPESRTVIRISGVQFMPEQDNKKFGKFWGQYSDEVTIDPVEERWDTYSNVPHPEIDNPCAYIWERFYVWFDGTCNPCDVDYKSELSPGKISKEISIKSIWDSENQQKLRETHLNGARSSFLPCDRCGVSH